MARDKDEISGAEQRILDAAMRLYARTGQTDLTVSQLAVEAGVARGTVYNYVQPTDGLFENVAARFAAEMCRRVRKSIASTPEADNPVARMAFGIRLYIRRAHDEPLWGRFICSFGFRAEVLQQLWTRDPMLDLVAGFQAGQYRSSPENVRSTLSFIAGVVTGGIDAVSTGHDTWRSAGVQAAEFVLRALGVSPETAHGMANQELPPLSPDE